MSARNRHDSRQDLDYLVAAEEITSVAEGLLERADVQPGMEVLDVACGTGNASLPAGRLGARVTGIDSRADMLDVARETALPTARPRWTGWRATRSGCPSTTAASSACSRSSATCSPRTRSAPAARDEARDARGRRDQHLLLGRRRDRSGACSAPRPSSPPLRRPARARRCCGARRTTCAHCSATAEFARREVEWIDDSSVETYADCMLESFGPLLNAQEALGERSGELRDAYLRHLGPRESQQRRHLSLSRRIPLRRGPTGLERRSLQHVYLLERVPRTQRPARVKRIVGDRHGRVGLDLHALGEAAQQCAAAGQRECRGG